MVLLSQYIKKIGKDNSADVNKGDINRILQLLYTDFKEYQVDIDTLSTVCEEILLLCIKTDLRYESFELWNALQRGSVLKHLLRTVALTPHDDTFSRTFLQFEAYVGDLDAPYHPPDWSQ